MKKYGKKISDKKMNYEKIWKKIFRQKNELFFVSHLHPEVNYCYYYY
jgi:hypothetical protein